MSMDAAPIIEFLLARIAEDEAAAREEDDDYADTTLLPTYDSEHQAKWNTARVLAECAAKRAILAEWGELPPIGWGIESEDVIAQQAAENTARALAAIYSDHPDYQQEWALNGTR